jgi:hypothetical protein
MRIVCPTPAGFTTLFANRKHVSIELYKCTGARSAGIAVTSIEGVGCALAFADRIQDKAERLRLGLAPNRFFAWVPGVIIAATSAQAQDAEPRAYSNAPARLNFLIAGYVNIQGKMAFDPTLPISDAKFHTSVGALAYVRTLDFGGKSAKFDVILPYSSFSANALVNGQNRERDMSGFGDPRFRFSISLFGAPALSAEEFANYRQDFIVGASVQVSAPLGRYDPDKLLNLGNNRWSFRPEIGLSKAIGPWTIEVAPSATYFTENTNFFNGRTLAQAPVYLLRGHLIYNFQSGVWVSLDGTALTGGHTSLNGVRNDNEQTNTRAGLTLALPLDRQNSLKFNASTGVSTRTGSEFRAVGIAWQHRWGAGY